jgi:acetoin utilization deacetylase AcuC-like enzyme
VETISQLCSSVPDHPNAVAHLDADTTMSRWSFEAALRAAGSVCEAVDKVVSGDFRNAFCAVRPPGHHAGPRGIVRCANDPDGGSHGFCFLNNVAIGAAYARSMYRNEGIRKIAIVDFDVHHGNGTEEIIRQLVPGVEKSVIRTPFAVGELGAPRYRPWLDETDVHDVFFASTHGYGPRGLEFADTPQGGWFYPASGKGHISDAIKNPSVVEAPNMTDFLSSQTWTRMGEDARANCCRILNCGLGLPGRDAVPGMQRLEVRDTYRQQILPHLREFDPDIIFISAGFDAHKKDSMNFGYVGMVEDDYEWVTEQLVRLANTCCNGRIVSVLEGGYKIHGGIVSPFARSVAAHVRGLSDGGRSRELYDLQDCEWESQFERHLIDERERKRLQKLEKMRAMEAQTRRALYGSPDGPEGEEDQATQPRKRKRNAVDYRGLYEQMKKEGFAS